MPEVKMIIAGVELSEAQAGAVRVAIARTHNEYATLAWLGDISGDYSHNLQSVMSIIIKGADKTK